MLLVPRLVRKTSDSESSLSENRPMALDEFRNHDAWVLLGEPGAGKTETFKKEAEAVGGEYLRIAEFIHTGAIAELHGKTLFLDGLDEVRGGSGDESILLKIQAHLKNLKNPQFRIACRAADWLGSTDREDIEGASPDGKITALLLNPLAEDDILAILRENHKIEDPGTFVEKAQRRGVANLLDNPQTLGLLASAIRDDQWPATRQDTFQLACEKLAEEQNKRHRNIRRSHPESTDNLLDAAGHLSAILLLCDKTGIALDPELADERFPYLDDCAPPERDAAYEAIRRKLFRLEKEECFVPSHRSIAEYLAARWIAERIDRYGLPVGRVLNLLLGRDSRAVAGLRGLYGWLALYCQAVRTRMIDADALTVVIYGDAKPLPSQDKRRILTGLRREAERYTAFRRDISPSHPFGALADLELTNDFITSLESTARDEATQSFTDCILEILAEGEPLLDLTATVKSVILDDTRWGTVRKAALQTWLKLAAAPYEALAMLDDIKGGDIIDLDDELAGLLLHHLYPDDIPPETLLNYLHIPKNSRLIGHFAWFWEHSLPKEAPDSHLPIFLDQLALRTDLSLPDIREYHFNRMVRKLVARGISLYGDRVTVERLFVWLGIGTDEYGVIIREKAERDVIVKWLLAHPDRYKELLSCCFNQCESDEHASYCIQTCEHRLYGAAVPEDIGLWHLEQASLIDNDTLAQIHLSRAIDTQMYQRGSQGISLEKIEAWGDAHTERKHWLESLLAWEVPEWRVKEAAKKFKSKQNSLDAKRERTIFISKHIPLIRSGSANAGLMHEIAGVWMNHFYDISGETLAERFDNYCDNGPEVLSAAKAGFSHCLERTDLPSVSEIIDLAIDQREHYIRLPCLVGMDLRWRQGLPETQSLSDDVLRRMLAFRMTYGADNTPDWFTYLVGKRPVLVAEVLVDYAEATLKSKQGYINSIYSLARDPDYRKVSVYAVPALLEHFPVSAKANQLNHLEHLLKSALRYRMEQLPTLIDKKVTLKSMGVAQKVYWLTAGMLLNSERYEAALWNYIGSYSRRANHISRFLSEDFGELDKYYQPSVNTIGKLIELLAQHADFEWSSGGGLVTTAMRKGDYIRALVSRLSASCVEEAANEIERLIALPSLEKLRFALENARHQLQLKQREREFNFLPLSGVAQVLANKEPVNVPDLVALTLDHLDDIAREIRQENDDGFRSFWNIGNKNLPSKREENYCRDFLLYRLRMRLGPLGIDCQPEGDYFNDKRTDIRLSYHNKFELPIEIKRDSNDTLWSALRSQLIGQYSIAPRAVGHGVYLVLWFGKGDITGAKDGKGKPHTPKEMKARLEAQLDHMEQRRVFVRVLDVSWPPTS
ncbi:MAG: hypothetical protein RPU59_12815 [Candidatus Sedimenticola sp. (ex Thyasira tokunagai)]